VNKLPHRRLTRAGSANSTSILRSSKPLRKVLAKPEFMAEFGEPKPFPAEKKKPKKKMKKGENSNDDDDERDDDESQSTERRRRRSVFGGEDALKVAPKGMDKNHPDIELLKVRGLSASLPAGEPDEL
jgi:hypothetical protein